MVLSQKFLVDQEISETCLEKLHHYDRLLQKWQKTINLVSPNSLPERDKRHFWDSAQLLSFLPDQAFCLVDMGSGAGFPGLVLAMLRPDCDVHLIESDQRKAIFLQTVSRETSTPVTVHNQRIEETGIPSVSVVTARALSSLEKLLDYTLPFKPEKCLFLKGETADQEIQQAQEKYMFHVKQHTSQTDSRATILEITNLVKNS